jgi:soluble lytic murein transglycosylase
MHQLFRPLPCLCVLAALAGTSHDALAARPKQVQQEKKSAAAPARPERGTAVKKEEKSAKKDNKKDDKAAKTEAKPKRVAKRHKKGRDDDKAVEKKPELTGDQAAVKDAMDLARRGKTNDAIDAAKKIADPAAQKLAEWFILRHSESSALFNRYHAAAPARRIPVVAGEERCSDRARLHRQSAADRARPLRARARSA